MEDVEVNIRRGTKRYVSGRARNLWYGAINSYLREWLMLTLGFSHPPRLQQFLLSTIIGLGALSGTSILITSGPSECAGLLKRVFLPGL